MSRKPEGVRADSTTRVSQNAPGFVSTSHRAWDDALSDPKFSKALDEGLADLAAGRTRKWGDIRRSAKSK